MIGVAAVCRLPRNAGFWVFRGCAFGGGADSGVAGRFWGEGFMRAAPGRRGGPAKPAFFSPVAAFWWVVGNRFYARIKALPQNRKGRLGPRRSRDARAQILAYYARRGSLVFWGRRSTRSDERRASRTRREECDFALRSSFSPNSSAVHRLPLFSVRIYELT